MSSSRRLLAVIPARGGSKGLPGKNIKKFLGLPLIAHSILFSQSCTEISRTIISTDSSEIAEVAKNYGAEVPFMRPPELAQDNTPIWEVLRHALYSYEQTSRMNFDLLLLLDPTSPARLVGDVVGALDLLEQHEGVDGVVGVCQPDFNPIWHCVIERNGQMVDLFEQGSGFDRRQDVQTVYRINGTLYIWRTDLLRKTANNWRKYGRHIMYKIPEVRSISIDDTEEFQKAESLVRYGIITLPWLNKNLSSLCEQ